jgi:formate dehydrogenase major subunit
MPRCRLRDKRRLDQDILAQIFLRVRELYKKEGGKFPDPILNATWAYTDSSPVRRCRGSKGDQRQSTRRHHRRKTNTTIKAGQQLPGFAWLRDDGTTIVRQLALLRHRGPKPARMMQRRGTDDPSGLGIYPNWGWSWPANRRVLYNRASCDRGPASRGILRERKQVWWNEATQSGWATTFRTSNPIPSPKITWDRSS